jgi:hypothetical protein
MAEGSLGRFFKDFCKLKNSNPILAKCFCSELLCRYRLVTVASCYVANCYSSELLHGELCSNEL